MNLRSGLLGALLLLWLCPSCEYSDSEIYLAEPEAGPEPVLNVSTNLDGRDSIAVGDSMLLRYTATIEHAFLYFIEASIDNLPFYRHNPVNPDSLGAPFTVEDSVWIDGDFPLDSGTYTLNLDFYHSTNSGSVADFLGVEFIFSGLEYEVILKGG